MYTAPNFSAFLKGMEVENSIRLMNNIFEFQLATHGLLQFALHGMLGEQQRATLRLFCYLLSKLLDYEVTVDEEMHLLMMQWKCILARMERDFPLGI